MIGLYLDWQRDFVDPHVARRFAASLTSGLDRPAGSEQVDGAVLIALCRSKAEASTWRAVRVPSGGLLLFTGFIDNGDALRHALAVPEGSAAELYAAGYARWGDDVDLRAIGQFATIIAYPDARRVRCARSPLHAPPLHLRHDRQGVAVASLARVLFSIRDTAAEVDEQKIADSLFLNYADAERGWYKGVTRVPTGHRVTIGPAGMTSCRYYNLAALPGIRLKHDRDYVEAANALLAEGTQAALAGFSRPAISLSGGLDSQAVTAFAMDASRGRKRILGLTAVPHPEWQGADLPGWFGDERHHVAALAAMYPDFDTEMVDGSATAFDHRLSAMFLMGGSAPRNVMNLHWVHAVQERARARGCDVLLVGTMGNLGFSFNGLGALPSWFTRGRWIRLARELAAGRGRQGLTSAFSSQVVSPLLPEPLRRQWRRWRSSGDHEPLDSWSPLRPDYAERMHVLERAAAFARVNALRSPRSTRNYRAHAMANAMTEAGEVMQAMELIHGIPTRDPTAYRPLIEFCFGIPDDQYLRDGQSRWLARRMLQGRVPEMVLNEQRRGLQSADWPLRLGAEREALRAEIEGLARDPAMADRLNLPRLRAALDRWSPEATGAADTWVVRYALLRAVATARFIRFVEGTNG